MTLSRERPHNFSQAEDQLQGSETLGLQAFLHMNVAAGFK